MSCDNETKTNTYDPLITVKKVKYVKEQAQLCHSNENQAPQDAMSKPKAKKTQPPASPRARVQKQIKYLGLCIEKEQEYEEYPEIYNDTTEREYLPIRELYIDIVKNSRKLTIESFERKGRSDLKRTAKSIHRIARKIAKGSHPLF